MSEPPRIPHGDWRFKYVGGEIDLSDWEWGDPQDPPASVAEWLPKELERILLDSWANFGALDKEYDLNRLDLEFMVSFNDSDPIIMSVNLMDVLRTEVEMREDYDGMLSQADRDGFEKLRDGLQSMVNYLASLKYRPE